MDEETKKLVDTWIKWTLNRADGNKAQDHELDFWAWSQLSDLVKEQPEKAWELIHEIRKTDSSDIILANLAAGPLENLIAQHGEKFIGRVETLALQDDTFLYMLTGVWGENRMPKELWAKLCAITKKSRRHL